MDQDHILAAPGAARSEATRWSEVLEAAQSRAAGGPEALARICERYWPPYTPSLAVAGTARKTPRTWCRAFSSI
jgi:hypothetical protein